MEEASNSTQIQNSDQIDLPEERISGQHSAGSAPAPVHVSGPTQWPPIQWFPIQGQWPTGPSQTWTQYGPLGEDGAPRLGTQPSGGGPFPFTPGANANGGSGWAGRVIDPNPLNQV